MIVVKMQQVNEGWFNTTDKVPDTALSMTVWANNAMQNNRIMCTA
jgi:hypothetical protein